MRSVSQPPPLSPSALQQKSPRRPLVIFRDFLAPLHKIVIKMDRGGAGILSADFPLNELFPDDNSTLFLYLYRRPCGRGRRQDPRRQRRKRRRRWNVLRHHDARPRAPSAEAALRRGLHPTHQHPCRQDPCAMPRPCLHHLPRPPPPLLRRHALQGALRGRDVQGRSMAAMGVHDAQVLAGVSFYSSLEFGRN